MNGLADAVDERQRLPNLVAVAGSERVRVLLREVLLDSLGVAHAPLSGPERAELVRRIDNAVAPAALDAVLALERSARLVLHESAGGLEDKLRQGRLRSSCGID